jgi:hypothetical protein
MVMTIRHLLVFTRVMLSPKTPDPLQESALSFRVWFGDLDSWIYVFQLVPQVLLMALRPSRAPEIWKRRPTMTHVQYADLAILGRISILYRHLRLGTREQMRAVIGGVTLIHLHGLRLFQKFDLNTRVVFWDERWLYFQTDFEREGMMMCTVLTKFMARNWAGPVPTAELLEKIGVTAGPPPLPPELKAMIEALAGP